jgi:hypothetical protein
MDSTDLARAGAFMPALLEAKQVAVEPKCAVHVSNEEHGPRVPPMNDLLTDGCLRHADYSAAERLAPHGRRSRLPGAGAGLAVELLRPEP